MHLDLRLCALALLPLSLTSTASAQTVYVDFQEIGPTGVHLPPAPSSYGGAFGQPGTWTPFDPINETSVVLDDATTGNPSGVTITSSSIDGVGSQNIMDAVNGPLFDDYARLQGDMRTFTFSGLAPDEYFVVTHGWLGQNTGMLITANGATDQILSTSSNWPGLIAPDTFVSQLATVDGSGQLVISIDLSISATQAVAGIQVIPGVPIGMPYCDAAANSSGMPADMVMLGTNDESAEAIGMVITDMPQFSFGFPIFSSTQGFSMPMGSCGNLCLGGTVYRWLGQGTSAGGTNTFQSDVSGMAVQRLNWAATAGPGNVDVNDLFMVGTTWNFQAWFRDAVSASSCSAPGGVVTSNFTNGYTVTWQ